MVQKYVAGSGSVNVTRTIANELSSGHCFYPRLDTQITVAVQSVVGNVRTTNEDNFLARYDPITGQLLLVVADGMGGHEYGEVASQMTCGAFSTVDLDHLLATEGAYSDYDIADVVHQAHSSVYAFNQEQGFREGHGSGTTVVALHLSVDPTKALGLAGKIVHIGDSRTYEDNGSAVTQLTEDHSLVQEMVQAGRITAEEAKVHHQRNIITQSIGAFKDLTVDDPAELDVYDGVTYLLCSDGFSDDVDGSETQAILTRHKGRLEYVDNAVKHLVQQALDNDSRDNVTVGLAHVRQLSLDEICGALEFVDVDIYTEAKERILPRTAKKTNGWNTNAFGTQFLLGENATNKFTRMRHYEEALNAVGAHEGPMVQHTIETLARLYTEVTSKPDLRTRLDRLNDTMRTRVRAQTQQYLIDQAKLSAKFSQYVEILRVLGRFDPQEYGKQGADVQHECDVHLLLARATLETTHSDFDVVAEHVEQAVALGANGINDLYNLLDRWFYWEGSASEYVDVDSTMNQLGAQAVIDRYAAAVGYDSQTHIPHIISLYAQLEKQEGLPEEKDFGAHDLIDFHLATGRVDSLVDLATMYSNRPAQDEIERARYLAKAKYCLVGAYQRGEIDSYRPLAGLVEMAMSTEPGQRVKDKALVTGIRGQAKSAGV